MEKRQLPDGPNSHQRVHLLGRLRKAVKWASLFAQLCAAKGDRRTSLEAEVIDDWKDPKLIGFDSHIPLLPCLLGHWYLFQGFFSDYYYNFITHMIR